MSEKELFENMYRLTMQLKGAPLKEFEKQAIVDAFNKADGAPFQRAMTAVAKVLHGTHDYIYEKGKVLDDVDKMIKEVKRTADTM